MGRSDEPKMSPDSGGTTRPGSLRLNIAYRREERLEVCSVSVS